MKTRSVHLLREATNISLNYTGETTSINFESPAWPRRTCSYNIPGKWELPENPEVIRIIDENWKEKTQVTLVNYDEVIPEPNYANQ